MWYVQMWTAAVQHPTDSELGVSLGTVEHGRWVAGDLWGTLDINPN